MALTLESLAAQMRPFHNDICIVHDVDLGRLLGVAESEDDLYYIVATLAKGVGYYSAVGRCLSLRGIYPQDAYASLDYSFKYGPAAPSETFLMKVLEPKAKG
jgi:hypothetical protein